MRNRTYDPPPREHRTNVDPCVDFEREEVYRHPPGTPSAEVPGEREKSTAFGGQRFSGRFSGQPPRGDQRADQAIWEDVCQVLRDDDLVDASDVTVRVDAGEVILEGTSATRHQKLHAEDLVERVPGVLEVTNRIRVRIPPEPWEPRRGDDGRVIPNRTQ